MRSAMLVVLFAAPVLAQSPTEKVLKDAGWRAEKRDLKSADGTVAYTVAGFPFNGTLAQFKQLPPLPDNYEINLPDAATDEWVAALAARKDRDKLVSLNLPETAGAVPLTDKVADHLPKFPNLVRFGVGSRSKVGAKTLTALQKLPKLRHLALAGGTADAGMTAVAGLTRLESLKMVRTPVSEAGVKQIGKLAALTDLYLLGVPVTEAGMAEVAKRNLVELNLTDSGATDAVAKLFADHPTLTTLSLSYSPKVTDAGLKAVAGNKPLKLVAVLKTGVTKAGKAEAEAANKNLVVLHD